MKSRINKWISDLNLKQFEKRFKTTNNFVKNKNNLNTICAQEKLVKKYEICNQFDSEKLQKIDKIVKMSILRTMTIVDSFVYRNV